MQAVAEAVVFSSNSCGQLEYHSNGAGIGVTTTDGTVITGDPPMMASTHYYYGTWWPQYWVPYTVPDKTGTAFRIAAKLMEKKVVHIKDDVKKFVELVNTIVEVL